MQNKPIKLDLQIVPVLIDTLKLSKKMQQSGLSEEVSNTLSYSLKEIQNNELDYFVSKNDFKNFEERINHRFDMFEINIKSYINSIVQKIEARFEKNEMRLDNIDAKLKEFDQQFKLINEKFDLIDLRFTDIDKRFIDIDRRFTDIDRRFTDIDKRFTAIDLRFDDIEKKIDNLRINIDEKLNNFAQKITIQFGSIMAVGVSLIAIILK